MCLHESSLNSDIQQIHHYQKDGKLPSAYIIDYKKTICQCK